MVDDALLSEDILYIVSSDYIEAYGQQLCNLTMTVDGVESEAANKHYVDNKLSGIELDSSKVKDIESIRSIVGRILSSFGGTFK